MKPIKNRWFNGWAVWLIAATASYTQASPAGLTGTFSGLVYDRASATFNSVLTLTNAGSAVAYAPISVVIATGSHAVTVSGSTDGSTYVANVPGGSIQAGQSAPLVVAFSDPTHVPFTPTITSITPTTTSQTSTIVSVDSSVPSSVIKSINQLISPAGSGSIGSSLPVSLSGPSAQSIVMGLDSSGNILLAAIVSSSQTVLSADSTALALVRLEIGDVPTTQSGIAIDSRIRATSGYTTLVEAVANALNHGTSPEVDHAVLQGIANVTVPVVAAIYTSSGVKALTVDKPTATTPLPFTVIADEVLNELPVQLTSNSYGQVGLTNAMPIPWQVSTVSVIGFPLTTDANLPSRSGLLSPGSISAGADNAGFNLTVVQSDQTHDAIGKDLLVGALKTTLGLAGLAAESCLNTAFTTALATDLDVYLDPGLPWSRFITQLAAFNVTPLIKACTSSITLKSILKATVNLLDGVAAVQTVANGVGVEAEAAYAYFYWDNPAPPVNPVGVCEGSDWVVANCATSYSFTPSSIVLAPSVAYDPQSTLTAMAGQQSTLVPAGLTYTAQTGAPFTVDSSTGQITATTNGLQIVGLGGAPYSVKVSDEATTATGVLSVSVVYPQIYPATSSTPVGGGLLDIVTLKLTDKNGTPVILPPGNANWTSSASTSQLQNLGSLTDAAVTSWYSPPGASPGTVTISAVGADGTPYGTATVTVGCSDLACKLAGKWLDSFGNADNSSNLWTINADGSKGTYEIYNLANAQPAPCELTPLPVSIQLSQNDSFIATVVLGPSNGVAPCDVTLVESLSLDSTGLIAQGTFTEGINSGSTTWTKASGSIVAVPDLTGFTIAGAQSSLALAGLKLGTVTTEVTPPYGGIISQSPAAFSSVASGSAVNVVVASSQN
jgi:hypothetical protein